MDKYPGEEHHYDQQPPIQPTDSGFYPVPEKISPRSSNPWRTVAVVLLIITFLLAGSTGILVYVVVHHSSVQAAGPGTVLSGTPTLSQTVPVGKTPLPTPVPTPSLTAVVTPQGSPTYASDATIPVNKTLTCSSNCNDPIRFTINTITIDNSDGRMLWNITLYNITAKDYGFRNMGISLRLASASPDDAIQATGLGDINSTLTTIRATHKDDYQLTFAFIPYQGIQYVFSAHLVTYEDSIDMLFDPVTFTF